MILSHRRPAWRRFSGGPPHTRHISSQTPISLVVIPEIQFSHHSFGVERGHLYKAQGKPVFICIFARDSTRRRGRPRCCSVHSRPAARGAWLPRRTRRRRRPLGSSTPYPSGSRHRIPQSTCRNSRPGAPPIRRATRPSLQPCRPSFGLMLHMQPIVLHGLSLECCATLASIVLHSPVHFAVSQKPPIVLHV